LAWREEYQSKIVSAERALKAISSGDQVYIHSGCAEPEILVKALIARAGSLRNVRIYHLLTVGNADYVQPEYSESFRHSAFFIGPNTREAVQSGRADYVPVFLSDVPRLMTSGALRIDVALIQVTPPDDHGFCSLGVALECSKTAALHASYVIAQVNPRMPRVWGDTFLPVRRLDAIVEVDVPLLELEREPITDLQRRIGQHVATLIDDGCTLQIGIGGIPDSVMEFLGDRQHLGVHTEMFSDGLIDLVNSGAVTGDQKTIHPGKIISSFVLGTRKVFDFIHDNPMVDFYPTSYVNDPFIISQNSRMVALNSALEVDLTGQVCADSLGHRFYSGFGGQVDFIRGAARSEQGKPIIALPSTAMDGTISRIVPLLKPGAGVVTSRGDVHYVATEYGVASLHGKSIRERAEALIAIAHPKFRDELNAAAAEQKYMQERDMAELLRP
jgi:4-hydroxybutyrate CoA-transferase